MSTLKCVETHVAFQEIPDEVSLVLSISGCRHHCVGCHSPFLRDDIGDDAISCLADGLFLYQKYITCVCFMGGDQNADELIRMLDISKKNGFKTALYTGSNFDEVDKRIINRLDYLKYGEYIEALGALDSENTNQRMIKIERVEPGLTITQDITSKFWKKSGGKNENHQESEQRSCSSR